ncbi:MFS transporter [Niastella yeongjuensis]|uniref:MFS transporter n=1 Tax=Niastella yeongjuensis TaxID=354355 RepID=A0A1V9EY04_9BACT|nr:MFS transporter [Niastella yeongjuensis]OQP51017.1 MFS transporter [Niastella yeongjuensis]SEN06657.1 Predicted arabinose efflux permease, MFS family [Niastella yeongjuensis]
MTSNTTIRKLTEFLGLKRSVVYLFGLTLLMLTGEKLWDRFLPKYLEGIGATTLIIGALGFLQNILNAFWSLPGGYMADRLGHRRSFLLFNLTAIAGYLVAIFFTNWIAVFIGMIFFSAWSAISLPASMSLIAKSLGSSKTAMGISMHAIIRRIPMAVGPIVGGFLITSYGLVAGIKTAFIISLVFCLLGMVLQLFIKDTAAAPYQPIHPVALWRQMDVRLKNLLVSDILIRFCEQIPYVFVVIWCLDIIKVSPEQFGLLTAIEMITAALIYIPVASFSDRVERKPFVVITFLFFTIFPVVLFFSKSFVALIVAFVIRGLKEFGEPTRKAIILDLCPKEAKARAYGLYYFIRDFIVSFAAFLGGFIWKMSPAFNLFTAAVFGVAGTLIFVLYGKGTDVKKQLP